MTKVYIVLKYDDSFKASVEGKICRFVSVYTSRKAAEKRRDFLDKHEKRWVYVSYHVIEKTLKGKLYDLLKDLWKD